MNEREKKLLIVVAVLVFGLINVGAYKLYYLPQKEAAQNRKK